MAAYKTNGHRTTLDLRFREEAYGVLDSMKVLDVQSIIKRAPRKEKDKAGRQRKIGANVAGMVRQLLHWEGKGEAEDGWIWKTAEEWELVEDGLTYRMLRTARDVAEAEGLLEYQERPYRDGRPRVYYRLNLVEVLRVVAVSELESAKKWLDRHPDSAKRPKWIEKRDKASRILEDLRAWGVAQAPASPGEAEDPGHLRGPECADPPYNLSGDPLQFVTPSGEYDSGVSPAGDSPERTTIDIVVASRAENGAFGPTASTEEKPSRGYCFSPEAEEAMRVIYSLLKQAGIEVPRGQYAAMKCEIERGEYPWDEAKFLADELIEHYEKTGVVDYATAWAFPFLDDDDLLF